MIDFFKNKKLFFCHSVDENKEAITEVCFEDGTRTGDIYRWDELTTELSLEYTLDEYKTAVLIDL